MAAGIDPIRFWNMTIDEISCAIYGYHQRMKWEAQQTYVTGTLFSRVLAAAFDKAKFPQLHEVYPQLFDPPSQAVPQWQIIKDRIMAHSEDYKRNRGE